MAFNAPKSRLSSRSAEPPLPALCGHQPGNRADPALHRGLAAHGGAWVRRANVELSSSGQSDALILASVVPLIDGLIPSAPPVSGAVGFLVSANRAVSD